MLGRVMMKESLTLVTVIIILMLGCTSIAQANVSIHITPSETIVAPGDIFTLDIVLDNPNSDAIFGIGIWLKYDAALLNVLDYDTGNWMTDGTNILDGPYHNPFNFPGESYAPNINDANTDGQIWWSVSESEAQWEEEQAPSGVFATIKFQAENSIGTTGLWFDGLGTGGVRDSFVLSKDTGMNILSSVSEASVNVVPEPSSVFLLGASLLGLFGFVRKKSLNKKKVGLTVLAHI